MNFYGWFTDNKNVVPAANESLVIFTVLLLGAGHTLAQAEDARSIMAQARKDAEKMTLPVNKYADEGMKAAQKTSNHFHSPEFQEKIKCEQQRLEKEVFADYTAPWQKKQQTKEGQATEAGTKPHGKSLPLLLQFSAG